MSAFKTTGPPVDIYEDGMYYYVFYPSDDTTCLPISPWGNVYDWIGKLNPRVWKKNSLGNKISFSSCPGLVQKAIMEEWKYQ